MKHLSNEQFIERMLILKDFEGHLWGITVCSVLQDFIRDLIKDGFEIKHIATILNFMLYEYNIKFEIKYYHVYHFVKQYINLSDY
jgi:hypothetical protein